MALIRIALPVAPATPRAARRSLRPLLPALACAAGLLAAHPAHADGTVSGNVAMVSDYVFRGLTQTWGQPALQGGAGIHADGFDAGFWGSSVNARSYPGGGDELDLYASYGRDFGDGFNWRGGLYGYLYPGANLDHAGLPAQSLDTAEANVALGWRWFTLQYNRALTDYFGAGRAAGFQGASRGTSYLQLDARFALGSAWTLALHVGHTHYTTTLAAPLPDGARNPSYSDYGITVLRQLDAHWSLGASLTHATNAAYYHATASYLDASDMLDVGGTRGLVMLQGSF
ncbi:MAG: TorF family putative porin [Metallibacterium scheffleri]|jgi:uncharacterized protein (TIGR02001 family)|uniref:TorF family putative porin n=1 Tax=Metallibacterium scheffleri TaxID=993689 RepID=UPI0026F10523|nr:TorF family putative porin [Metallibacterium scheffleri]MCK9366290.1 TorF family putative porin [Metallibacterium scheffleri]